MLATPCGDKTTTNHPKLPKTMANLLLPSAELTSEVLPPPTKDARPSPKTPRLAVYVISRRQDLLASADASLSSLCDNNKNPMPRRCARNTPAPGLPVKGSSCERNVIQASAANILCEGSKGGIKKEVSTQFYLFYFFYFYLLTPSPSFTHFTPPFY